MFALWNRFLFLITAYRFPRRATWRSASYKLHISSFACRSYISHSRLRSLLGDHTPERIDGALTSGWSNILHLTSGSSSIRENYPSNRAGWVLLKQHVSCVDIVVLMVCIILHFSYRGKSMDRHIYEGEADRFAWKDQKNCNKLVNALVFI